MFSVGQITKMLSLQGSGMDALLAEAHRVRVAATGECIRPRGLIEYSNLCRKNCLYCGIRSGMDGVGRYTLSEGQVMEAARRAVREGLGSVVIQAGEVTTREHIEAIERLVREIKLITPESAGVDPVRARGWSSSPGVTLSLGEQSLDVYRRWADAGASRYLLRIEASDEKLYRTLHPHDGRHSYRRRIEALENLRKAGYQVGTGVMIGLPGQNAGHLAADLLFMQRADIDMCGMGPYVECAGTPLAGLSLPPARWRVDMTLKMTAVLRLMMPDINIAAATALETLDPHARSRALSGGANVVMPNVTPRDARSEYRLYDNKEYVPDFKIDDYDVCKGAAGDSIHFEKKLKNI